MTSDFFIRNFSKTKCWAIGLAICLLLCSPSIVSAAYSSGSFGGRAEVDFSGGYDDADGGHGFTLSPFPRQDTASYSSKGVTESPLGDQETHSLGGGGVFSRYFVGYVIPSFSLSLGGTLVKPTESTYSVADQVGMQASGSYFGTNDYFPINDDAANEKIFGEYSVGLSGNIAPGMTLTVGLEANARFVATATGLSYTFHEGPFSIFLHERSPDYFSYDYQNIQGNVSMAIGLYRDPTSDIQNPGNTSITGSGFSGVMPSSTYQPGDYNYDGVVDGADYFVWRQSDGQSSNLNADGNFDGTVDAADYVVWRKNLTAGGNGASVATASAPEPASLLLLMIGAMMLLQGAHRR